jgi:hypothetical protein
MFTIRFISRGHDHDRAERMYGPQLVLFSHEFFRPAPDRRFNEVWRDAAGVLVVGIAATFLVRSGNMGNSSPSAWEESLNGVYSI